MEKFTRVEGIAAPLMISNIDTGAIISSLSVRDLKDHFERRLFETWRFNADGTENAEFVLNKERYRASKFLIAGANFACGSSREMAVWALAGFGIRCVIAPSFGEIFYENSFQNQLLPLSLPEAEVNRLARAIEEAATPTIAVDLELNIVVFPDGTQISFQIPRERRLALLEGLDETAQLLRLQAETNSFQHADRERRPWIYTRI